MNRIEIKESEIKLTKVDDSIELIVKEKNEIFDILSLEIHVLKNSSLEIKNTGKKSKLDIKIYVGEGIKFNLIEGRDVYETKIQNKFFLSENSQIFLKRLYHVSKAKQLDLIFLNGENAKMELDFVNMALDKGKYDIMSYHNAKKTTFNLQNKGVTIEEGSLEYHVTGLVYQGNKECVINQNNRILALNDTKNIIEPILLVEEEDILANHSALIGNIDEDVLFYLESRGIKKEDAIKLIIKGYLDVSNKMLKEIVDKYWR